MKIKDKMVELKDRGIGFVKEHKEDIILFGAVVATELAFYHMGRKDGIEARDRDWNEVLDGTAIVDDKDLGDWIRSADNYYRDGDAYRERRTFSMETIKNGKDGADDDITTVSDLGSFGAEMIRMWNEHGIDVSNEKVTHVYLESDPETGK